MPVPWGAINNALSAYGAPILGISDEESYNAFDQRMQSTQGGALHTIADEGASYDKHGIAFNSPDEPTDMVNDQEVIDQSHANVKSMAASELSRSKK